MKRQWCTAIYTYLSMYLCIHVSMYQYLSISIYIIYLSIYLSIYTSPEFVLKGWVSEANPVL